MSARRMLTLAGGLLLLGAALAGWSLAPRAFLAAWLSAWWCAAGIVMGACVNLWIHALTGGRWGTVLRPAAAAIVARRAWLGALFVPVALGLGQLYPWASGASEAFARLDEPGFARAWLSVPAFAVRCTLCGALWYGLAGSALRPAISRRRAAASLVLYGLTGSLAAVDLLMSLVPGWRSTGFALLVLTSQGLGGAALMVAATAWQRPAALRAAAAREVPVSRDLGNLLLMFVMIWGYLGFMQFLIIWAENLPAEISWFVPRLQTGWYGVGVMLVGLQLALPMLALVMRAMKDDPRRLGAVAVLVLGAHLLDVVWLVVPSVDAAALSTWWLAPMCMGGMGLVLFAPLGGQTPEPSSEAHHARA